jgi:hypothetical protein
MFIILFFFMIACLVLIVGGLVLLVYQPDPDGWWLEPIWHGLGFLHICAIPVVALILVGFPLLFFADGIKGEGVGRFVPPAILIMLIDVPIGSYAAFHFTGRRYRWLRSLAAYALAALFGLGMIFGNHRGGKCPRGAAEQGVAPDGRPQTAAHRLTARRSANW